MHDVKRKSIKDKNKHLNVVVLNFKDSKCLYNKPAQYKLYKYTNNKYINMFLIRLPTIIFSLLYFEKK